jgi:hypothetical protein
MLLEQITIDENIFKRLNPFKRKKYVPHTQFDKIKEINNLKKLLKSDINEYIKKVSKDPKNKSNYFDELGELLLNDLSTVISKLQTELSTISEKPILEDVEDKTLIRNLNFLFKELDLIDEAMELVEVEKILLHIYKKLKEHLDIKFPLDSEYDDIDPESEHEDYKKYLEKFYKYPTIDFDKLQNIDIDKIGYEFYKQVKEKNKQKFDKEWNEKYKNEWLENDIENDIMKDWKSNTNINQTFNNFKSNWIKTYITPETEQIAYDQYFTLWYNTMLKAKFNQLWYSTFRPRWIQIYKKNINKERDKLSFLKENINNIFRKN